MSAMKRAGMRDRPQLLEIFLKFIPFLNPGYCFLLVLLIVAVAISFVEKWTVFLCLFKEKRQEI
jgi:hypothetical protein